MDDQDATEFMDDDSNDANSPAAENDQTAYEDTAGPSNIEPVEVGNTRTLGQPLSDFLMTLEDYTPTVSQQQIKHIICSINVSNNLFLDPRCCYMLISCLIWISSFRPKNVSF